MLLHSILLYEKHLVFLSLFISSIVTAQSLNSMTFNIRYSTLRDNANAWIYRKDHVAEQVKYHQVQLPGVQEALHEQMLDLKERLPQFKLNDFVKKPDYSICCPYWQRLATLIFMA